METPSAKPVKLSIVTINRNNAAGLAKTLDSVRMQSFRDFEQIVIDGGSTDGSREILVARADALAYWVSEPDAGVYAAMNKGLKRARGEYVQFLNSGDCLASPSVLDSFFGGEKLGEDLLYGDFQRVDVTRRLPSEQPRELTVMNCFRHAICHQSIFYKRELFDQLGPYDERLRIAADWGFNIRVLLAGRSTRHLPVTVVQYEGAGISENLVAVARQEKLEILRRLFPDAVYRDYLRMLFLEGECLRLKEFEDWTAQIRRRNLFVNIAMVSKWHWDKWTGRKDRRR